MPLDPHDWSIPAFPRPVSVDPGGNQYQDSEGMTLRQYYFGQIMQGLIIRSIHTAPNEPIVLSTMINTAKTIAITMNQVVMKGEI